uniref:Uncharacterized protein n=1 Tax=Caenorhabditis japonica TaxID=281687 RepID=A0A8R1EMG8_CAEJA
MQTSDIMPPIFEPYNQKLKKSRRDSTSLPPPPTPNLLDVKTSDSDNESISHYSSSVSRQRAESAPWLTTYSSQLQSRPQNQRASPAAPPLTVGRFYMVNPAARGQSAAVSHYHPPRQETLSAHINEESSSLSSTDSRENSVNPYAIPHAQGRPNQSPSTRTVQVPLEVEATAQQGEQLYYSRPPQIKIKCFGANEAYSDPPPYCSMVGNNDNND